tara:strand:+ start:261 stop:575 length:315 start_codon:yes stop_codon:yes gene_type:complete
MTDKKPDFDLEIRQEDAVVASFMLWHALCDALVLLGRTQGNNGWREALYDATMRRFEAADLMTFGPSEHQKSALSREAKEAQKAGSKLIDAAFDRIKFTGGPRG